MPKSTKKKKEKASDFTKAKLKLGKGKKLANNAVDTSFKAQSIALPKQSIVVDKSQAGPSTKRKHTLDDLLALLRHYSPNSRRESIYGLREILTANRELVDPSINSIVGSCCKIVSDEDPTVRKALIEFLDWYLHIVPKASLVPHASTLMLFTTSAQTHIFPEIRLDAVKILDILLDVLPGIVTSFGVNGHGNRVLRGYLSLLQVSSLDDDEGPSPFSGVAISVQSKLLVLQSLERFLREAQGLASMDDAWYLRSSFSSNQQYEVFSNLFSLTTRRSSKSTLQQHFYEQRDITFSDNSYENVIIPPKLLDQAFELSAWTESDLGIRSTGSLQSIDTPDSGIPIALLEKALHKLLEAVYLDNASAAFISHHGSKTELRLAHIVGKITEILYMSLLRQDAAPEMQVLDNVNVLLNHFSLHFPFGGDAIYHESDAPILHDMNVIYCELLALVALSASTPHVSNIKSRPRSKIDLMIQTERAGRWIEEGLGSAVMSNGGSVSFTQDSISSILPTVWVLLNQTSPRSIGDQEPLSIRLLDKLVDYSNERTAKRSGKDLIHKFLAILLVLQTEPGYIGTFQINPKLPHGAILSKGQPSRSKRSIAIERWLLNLPKILWELGTTNINSTEAILLYLLRAGQRGCLNSGDSTQDEICKRFMPFFAVVHPIHGVVYGPFRKFAIIPNGEVVQRLSLNVAWTLTKFEAKNSNSSHKRKSDQASDSQTVRDNLKDAVTSAVEGSGQDKYWMQLN